MAYILKTQLTDENIENFLNTIEEKQKRDEAFILLDMFNRITKIPAKMRWTSIIGFGSYHYTYASGQTGDWMRTGFSPRKTSFSVYVMPGYNMWMESLLKKLGKHKMWKSCLTIKKLSDVDLKILEQIIQKGLDIMEGQYPSG